MRTPSAPAPGRIMLLPGLRIIWRGERDIQLGTDPDRAIVITLPDRAVAGVFDLLRGDWTERGAHAEAVRRGLAPADVAALLATLRDAGVLFRADALLPPALPEPARRRLIAEATALALARRPSVDALMAAHAIAAERARAGVHGPSAPAIEGPGGADPTSSGAATTPGGAAATSSGETSRATPSTSGATPDTDRASRPGGAVAIRRPARAGNPDKPTPAESMRRRGETSVRITGLAWLVAPIAAGLARAGIGRVYPLLTGRTTDSDDMPGGLLPEDEHRPRATAAGDAVRRAAPYADTRAVPLARASFVVLVGQRTPPRLAAAGYARRRQPYLLVEVRDGTVIVGPLVPPGTGPCLQCVDLHRLDRDPAWPAVSAQLATRVDEVAPAGVAATLVGVGVAVAQVLAYVDGEPVVTCGASLEIGPDALPRRRPWATHPRCDGRHGAGAGQRARDGRVGRFGPG